MQSATNPPVFGNQPRNQEPGLEFGRFGSDFVSAEIGELENASGT
jgi:hypothetical protein